MKTTQLDIDEKFTLLERNYTEGNYQNILHIINDIDYSSIDESQKRLLFYYKALSLNKIGQFAESIILIKKFFTKGSFKDSIDFKFAIVNLENLWRLGRLDEAFDILENTENSLHLLETSNEKLTIKSELLHQKGTIYYVKGDLDKSISILRKSLTLRKKLNDNLLLGRTLNNLGRVVWQKGDLDKALTYLSESLKLSLKEGDENLIAKLYNNIGRIYRQKGFLDIAYVYFKKGLAIREKLNNFQETAFSLTNIAILYHQEGNIEQSFQVFVKALELHERIGNNFDIAETIFRIIFLLVNINDDRCESYLTKLEQIKEILVDNNLINQQYSLSKALILKNSIRNRHKVEAEIIFEQILKEETTNHEYKIISMYNLCDLLLSEYQITNNQDLLDEIRPLINRLVKISEEQKSSAVLADVYWLETQISLVNKLDKDFNLIEKLITEINHENLRNILLEVISERIPSDHLTLGIIEGKYHRRLTGKDYSTTNLKVPEYRALSNDDGKATISELAWRLERPLIINSRKELVKLIRKPESEIPKNIDKVLAIPINRFTIQFIRTETTPRFTQKDVDNLNAIRLLIRSSLERLIGLEDIQTNEERKRDYLSGFIHDLRNPLHTMSLYIEMLKEGVDDINHLESFEVNVKYLTELVESFSNSLYEPKDLIPKRKSIRINELVANSISSVQVSIQKADHTIKLDIDENLSVIADYSLLRRVMRNLLVNAINYTPKGGEITIKSWIEDKSMKISIKDSGYGIKEEDIEKLFNKFTSVHQEQALKKRGLGLGLWLTKEIITAHRGTISVFSEGLGKGSEFIISLPYIRNPLLQAQE